MRNRLVVACSLAAALLLTASPLAAQDTRDRRLPLGPNRPSGEGVAPFLEAWYANPDGTYTLSFGYFNFNLEEALEIPIGPDNRIEPIEFDGMQPTYFPTEAQGHERHERGVFTVTVPSDYAGGAKSVIWTLTANGETNSLTASVGAQALQSDYRGMAVGSVPPYLSFTEDGPTGQYPPGIRSEESLGVQMEQPLTLSVWTRDPSVRSPEILGVLYREVPVNIVWYKHQGPVGGEVTFERVT
ncbi:MAG TPA: hypothetical protein VLA09_09490, partial [Longimicrobiales bacterium]|nr:hypothetical protein [Longimicrobiales bacterium]